MSLNDMKYRVGKFIGIDVDNFDIQVYDECFKGNIVLDDELVEDLNERLPRAYRTTLSGDILLNYPASNCCVVDQSAKKAMLDHCDLELPSEWNSIDNGNTASQEVSILRCPDNEPEYFEKLLATTPEDETEQINTWSSIIPDYVTETSEPLTDTDQLDLLSSNDEIQRNICQPYMTFPSDGNELYSVENTNFEAQLAVQSVVEAVVEQSSNIASIQEESLYSDWNEETLDHPSFHTPDVIVQEMPSMQLSSSLQFVHDVQPFQKTQHHTDNSDMCSDKNHASYVMRIQGRKTDADKRKNILPRLKLPPAYISTFQQGEQRIYLMVAVIWETKVNNKRIWYTCNDMQFLPDNTNKETEALNPIQLNLHTLPIELDGTFNLSLRLINMSKFKTDQGKNKPFHELDEEIAKTLHPSPYDSRFFRLGCTLVENNIIAWDTLCLSDYIRPKQRLQT